MFLWFSFSIAEDEIEEKKNGKIHEIKNENSFFFLRKLFKILL